MIRPPRPHEVALLPQIENEADLRYARVGLKIVVDMPPASIASLELARRHGGLWVAVSPPGRPIGFALMRLRRSTHVSTYRDVPWNAPPYQRRGFSEVPPSNWSMTTRHQIQLENGHGHPPWRRIVMQRCI
jgi:hypothetical protein